MGSEGVGQSLGRVAATALVICASLFGMSGGAFAASPSDPISIDDCHINNNRAFVSAFRPLAITFTNRRSVAADEVRFTVEYAGKMGHVADTGTVSQNIGIHHAFNAFYGVPYSGFLPKSCTVDYVHFADGSVWTPQPLPAPMSAPH